MYCIDLHVPVLYMYVSTVDLALDLVGRPILSGPTQPSNHWQGCVFPVPTRDDIPLDPGVPELALQVHDHLAVEALDWR